MPTSHDYIRQANAFLDRHLTRGVKWLLLINVAVFFIVGLAAMVVSEDLLIALFAQNPIVEVRSTYEGGTRWVINWLCLSQFFTYMFLHADVWHLFVNMLGLWFFGPPIEQRWGTVTFVKFYLFTGFAAGALHGLLAPMFIGKDYYMLGASGAVFGVLLAFALYYPHQQILLWFVLPIPARVLVILIALLTFYSLVAGASPNISHLTHLAGFGFAYLWIRVGEKYPDWWLFNADPGPFRRRRGGRGGGGGFGGRFVNR